MENCAARRVFVVTLAAMPLIDHFRTNCQLITTVHMRTGVRRMSMTAIKAGLWWKVNSTCPMDHIDMFQQSHCILSFPAKKTTGKASAPPPPHLCPVHVHVHVTTATGYRPPTTASRACTYTINVCWLSEHGLLPTHSHHPPYLSITSHANVICAAQHPRPMQLLSSTWQKRQRTWTHCSPP